MKNPILLSVLLIFCLSLQIDAQDKLSWRKHAKLAEELYAKSQFADAAEHFRAAWKKKTKKKEYIYRAGESFFLARDYKNAAEAWRNVKNDVADFPKIGLQYALSLKQNGEYEAASSELVNFMSQYQGSDKAAVLKTAKNELRGCELATQFGVQGPDENIFVDILGSNINTPETEFAPMPFGDEALYFSSTMGKRAEIYRSIKSGERWSKATPIENFPKIKDDHFCNGSLTPDATRFYFTICSNNESWGGQSSECALYVSKRLGKAWTNPERLPDYLNEVNTTSTHPHVIHEGDTEILYFASNRKGGRGGMDIWYATREVNSTANDFTLPINAGAKINTTADEITPHYNQVDDVLYFASNGHVGIGGYDIYMGKGAKAHWSKVENLGLPINSSADDFFFVKTNTGNGGFIVSNRTYDMQKNTTTDEDIFSFEYKIKEQRWVAKGEVYSKETKQILNDVEVTLYEVDASGQNRFLDKIVSANGLYEFEVKPAKRYKLEVLKDGHFPQTYDFDTRDYTEYDDFGAPIFMERYYEGYQDEAVTTVGKQKETVVNSGIPSTAKVNNSAKTEMGTYAGNTTTPTANNSTYERFDNSQSDVVKVSETVTTISGKKERNTVAEVYSPEVTEGGKTATGGWEDETASNSRAGQTYYKIQIIAMSKFDVNQSRFNRVKNMGNLDTEFLPDRGWYRVLIADYDTISDAKKDLARVRGYRDFHDAFLVEYRDGQRIRDVH